MSSADEEAKHVKHACPAGAKERVHHHAYNDRKYSHDRSGHPRREQAKSAGPSRHRPLGHDKSSALRLLFVFPLPFSQVVACVSVAFLGMPWMFVQYVAHVPWEY
ncbi:hypothetical protein HYDPIDRAFT_29252 [Hydnomerulius pinastri MD-312]|uniref:Uncharacterized protein n=1 Tax=Hydnomerulius pinastri MD-312 TaxID=994086 RepID=A0A0C9W8N0_9AGAM|nr:hypothetical protein HYDPIDRAFT_29252 [Hydnomerulius pinastri MD-312]